jgi:sulfur carrier protein
VKLVVNGTERQMPDGLTVAALVESEGGTPGARGVAVAVDAEVVPRSEWEERELRGGERVEILAAIQGGAK